MQIIESKKTYDVIIVGSGAGGGMATKVLADAGLKVAVIEAGPFFDPADPKTRTQLKWPYESQDGVLARNVILANSIWHTAAGT